MPAVDDDDNDQGDDEEGIPVCYNTVYNVFYRFSGISFLYAQSSLCCVCYIIILIYSISQKLCTQYVFVVVWLWFGIRLFYRYHSELLH